MNVPDHELMERIDEWAKVKVAYLESWGTALKELRQQPSKGEKMHSLVNEVMKQFKEGREALKELEGSETHDLTEQLLVSLNNIATSLDHIAGHLENIEVSLRNR